MNPKELSTKTVLILGAGKTGISAAQFLLDKANKILLSDAGNIDTIYEHEVSSLKKNGVEVETNKNSEGFLNQADLIIVSPGISPFTKIIQAAQAKNIPTVSDIELASYFTNKPLICITGTNGKTTTTSLITHILNKNNISTLCCGNIGTPIFNAIKSKKDFQYLVIEVSSYQIFYSPTLSAYISVCLNITPDHLDWHKSFDHYISSKKKLFDNQKKDSWAILNATDSILKNFHPKNNIFYFTTTADNLENYDHIAFFEDSYLKIKYKNNIESIIHKDKLNIFGMHNIENTLASIAVSRILDIKSVQDSLTSFQGVEHRLERTKSIGEKEFYNDSKATNPESTIKAIEAIKMKNKNKKLSLILGGKDKNTNLDNLITAIKENIDYVILLGEARNRFNNELLKYKYNKGIKMVNNLEEAVKETLSSNTDIVLFSPACSSFDMFKNYEERGKHFKEIINKL